MEQFNDLYIKYKEGTPISEGNKQILVRLGYLKQIDGEFLEPQVKKEVKDEKTLDEKWHYYQTCSIIKDEWKPNEDDRTRYIYEKEFIYWIDVINTGHNYDVQYGRFNCYVKQANDWLSCTIRYGDFEHNDIRREQFRKEEFRRCKKNSLYFLVKYVKFAHPASPNGVADFQAYQAHRIVSYLIDCGYNLMIGKPRQVFFTTTIAGISIKDIHFNKNYFTKLVTENFEKGKEQFRDKYKFVFYNLPDWMRSSVMNNDEAQLWLGKKIDKNTVIGLNSGLKVEAPYDTVINGGAPNRVLLDELAQIPDVDEIIAQGKPTIMNIDPITGKYKQLRQLVAWGTGAKSEKYLHIFQNLFNSCIDAWRERDFSNGIVPIFMSWLAKPGYSQPMYDSEKKNAYRIGTHSAIVTFNQTLPSTIDDMFISSIEPIIPMDDINKNLKRIYKKEKKSVRGIFEPIYDTKNPNNEGFFVPYKIIGVRFNPLNDDQKAPVIMHEMPLRGWKHRYYDAIDPINSQSGYSNFASAVWDNHVNKVVCEVDFRSVDYRNDYLQAILMGLYYDVGKTLIESNVGRELINMYDALGLGQKLCASSMLPSHLQVSGSDESVGIKKVGANSPFIIGQLKEMLSGYGENQESETFFNQLKNFVPVDKKNITNDQTVTYKTKDYRMFKDDIIFAYTYAYIVSRIYAHHTPISPEMAKEKKVQYKYVCNETTGWVTQRVPIRQEKGDKRSQPMLYS